MTDKKKEQAHRYYERMKADPVRYARRLELQKKNGAKYRTENKERIAELAKKSRQRNYERYCAKRRVRYQINKEKNKAYRREYYRKHREEILEKHRERMNDPEYRKHLADIEVRNRRKKSIAKKAVQQAQRLYEQTQAAVADFEKLFENWE